MKKAFFVAILVSLLSTNVTVAEEYCGSKPLSNVIGAVDTLNNSTDLSSALLIYSQRMLELSESILSTGSTINKDYVNAMLQLSSDIGKMADRIGDMSDRILVMADDIGEMSERILLAQKNQSQNVAITQANIAKATENFNLWLKQNRKMAK